MVCFLQRNTSFHAKIEKQKHIKTKKNGQRIFLVEKIGFFAKKKFRMWVCC